jgi:hypothetical protein
LGYKKETSTRGRTEMNTDLAFASLFGVAILFTGLAYVIGISVAEQRMRIVGSLLIGVVVVTLGYVAKYFHAPIWLVIALPIPFGIIILWYVVGKRVRQTIVAYITTWIAYLVFHVLLSAIFHYDSLIPPWHLHP